VWRRRRRKVEEEEEEVVLGVTESVSGGPGSMEPDCRREKTLGTID